MTRVLSNEQPEAVVVRGQERGGVEQKQTPSLQVKAVGAHRGDLLCLTGLCSKRDEEI